MQTEAGWATIDVVSLCDNPFVRVASERVATPSRPEGVTWTVARRPPAVVVAPRRPDGRWLLIRQERVAVRRVLWEFPAGQIDDETDDAAVRATALRELGGEAGVTTCDPLEPLGMYFSSVGFTDEHMFLFLANNVVPRGEGMAHDDGEAILEVRAFGGDELKRMVAGGEIVDANTLATVARLMTRGML